MAHVQNVNMYFPLVGRLPNSQNSDIVPIYKRASFNKATC